jgi:hypothetical protein
VLLTGAMCVVTLLLCSAYFSSQIYVFRGLFPGYLSSGRQCLCVFVCVCVCVCGVKTKTCLMNLILVHVVQYNPYFLRKLK